MNEAAKGDESKMRQIEVVVEVGGRSAAEVYAVLRDFGRYPEYSDAVRSVEITDAGGGCIVSRWEVNFHRGILRWAEEDRFDAETRTISFRQIEGDVDHFSGEWVVGDHAEGSFVRFAAELDLGIPGLSEVLEPIAEQALRDNVRSILSGLFDAPVELELSAPARRGR